MSAYKAITENDSDESPPAIVEIVGYLVGDEMKVIAQAANPFDTEDAFPAARDIAAENVHETVAELFDPEKLEGQRHIDVNQQMLARLAVSQEIEAAEFNGELLADDADPHAFDVPTVVV